MSHLWLDGKGTHAEQEYRLAFHRSVPYVLRSPAPSTRRWGLLTGNVGDCFTLRFGGEALK